MANMFFRAVFCTLFRRQRKAKRISMGASGILREGMGLRHLQELCSPAKKR